MRAGDGDETEVHLGVPSLSLKRHHDALTQLYYATARLHTLSCLKERPPAHLVRLRRRLVPLERTLLLLNERLERLRAHRTEYDVHLFQTESFGLR